MDGFGSTVSNGFGSRTSTLADSSTSMKACAYPTGCQQLVQGGKPPSLQLSAIMVETSNTPAVPSLDDSGLSGSGDAGVGPVRAQ